MLLTSLTDTRKFAKLVVVATLLLASCREDVEETKPDEELLILLNYAAGDAVLVNREGDIFYDFDLQYPLGNDAYLQEDGSLIGMAKADTAYISFGGFGGRLFKQNPDKSIDWEFQYSTQDYISHHDVEVLPNGNIMFLIWERINQKDASEAGFAGKFDIFPDAIIEMDPQTEEETWEWHMIDHVIQDKDPTKDNFGSIADHPHKIDLNYNNQEINGDITHANGLTYDADQDLVYISVNHYNEIWLIDHSTTMREAASGEGGNHGRGGDLIYRFGNPFAYDNSSAPVTFDGVHYPNLLPSGNLLVFSNQILSQQSEVLEFSLPSLFALEADSNNEPEIVWSFTDSDLFSNIVSGAARLRDGNTLITEGSKARLLEVNGAGMTVWSYQFDEAILWRAYPYYRDHPGILEILENR